MHGKRHPGRGKPAAGHPAPSLLFGLVKLFLFVLFLPIIAVVYVGWIGTLAMLSLAFTPPRGGD